MTRSHATHCSSHLCVQRQPRHDEAFLCTTCTPTPGKPSQYERLLRRTLPSGCIHNNIASVSLDHTPCKTKAMYPAVHHLYPLLNEVMQMPGNNDIANDFGGHMKMTDDLGQHNLWAGKTFGPIVQRPSLIHCNVSQYSDPSGRPLQGTPPPAQIEVLTPPHDPMDAPGNGGGQNYAMAPLYCTDTDQSPGARAQQQDSRQEPYEVQFPKKGHNLSRKTEYSNGVISGWAPFDSATLDSRVYKPVELESSYATEGYRQEFHGSVQQADAVMAALAVGHPTSSPTTRRTEVPTRGALSCTACLNIYTGLWAYSNLRRHIRHKHRPSSVIECCLCGRTYKRSDALGKHMREKHTSQKQL